MGGVLNSSMRITCYMSTSGCAHIGQMTWLRGVQVEVEGIVRDSEHPSRFVPANDDASGQWFWIDVPALAAACGLPRDTLLVEVT